MCVLSGSIMSNSTNPWTVAPLSMGFSRQEYWSGLPFPSPGDLPDPGIKLVLLCLLHWRWILYPLSYWGSRFGLWSTSNKLHGWARPLGYSFCTKNHTWTERHHFREPTHPSRSDSCRMASRCCFAPLGPGVGQEGRWWEQRLASPLWHGVKWA